MKYCIYGAGVAHTSRAAAQHVQSNAFKRLASTTMTVAREEGLRGFYAGMLPNILQVLPHAALNYWAYETFKKLLEVPE